MNHFGAVKKKEHTLQKIQRVSMVQYLEMKMSRGAPDPVAALVLCV